MLLLEVDHLACSLRTGRGLFGIRTSRSILRDVSFSIERGSIYGLLGPSGAGKTTIARCIAGMLEPDSGVIRFAGETLWPRKSPRAATARIQMLFQASGLSLDPTMRVREAIDEGFTPMGKNVSTEEKLRTTSALLDAVGLRKDVLDRYPAELSGGQRQRVALTRSLASGPSLLILDEPTAALDQITQSGVLSLLLSLRRSLGLSMLYITHDRRTALAICDTIGELHDGFLTPVGVTRGPRPGPHAPS